MQTITKLPLSRGICSGNRISSTGRERGAVFLFALVLTGIVATLAASFGSSIRLQIKVASNAAEELKSDLATQSGLEFSQRQLLLDPNWQGTGVSGIDLDGIHFDVGRVDSGGLTTLNITGQADSGISKIIAEFTNSTGLSTSDKALLFLGSDFDITSMLIKGDLLLPDSLGVVSDWLYDPLTGSGSWVPGGPDQIGSMWIQWSQVTGSLFKYTDNVYIGWGTDEQIIDQTVRMPAWNLDSYLVPQSGVTIFDHVDTISQTIVNDLAVFILDPGQTLTINQCQLLGGVVVYCEPEYDLRSGPRNTVHFSSCQIGTSGSSSRIGLLAPGAKVTTDPFVGGGQVHGFSFWNSGEGIRSVLINGQLVVVNKLTDFANAQVVFNPNLLNNEPEGIIMADSAGGPVLQRVWENYN